MIAKIALIAVMIMSPSATEPPEGIEFDGITVETHSFVLNDREPEYVVELLRENFEVHIDTRRELLKNLKMPKYRWIKLSSEYRYISLVADGTYLYTNGISHRSFKVFLHNGPLNVKE